MPGFINAVHSQEIRGLNKHEFKADFTRTTIRKSTPDRNLAAQPASEKDTVINLVNKKARKRALQSAVLPGLGQIQNGQLWKAPLVWGGLGLTTYFIIRNNNRFQEFAKAFRLRTDQDSTTIDKFDPTDRADNDPPFYSKAALKDGRETFRRNRTLSIISTFAVYLANVIDAYVFAHLQDFDVSDDLSMSVRPPRIANIAQQPGVMAGISLKLKR